MITIYAMVMAVAGMLGCVGVLGIHARGVEMKMLPAMIEAAEPPPTAWYREQAEKQFQIWREWQARELVKDK